MGALYGYSYYLQRQSSVLDQGISDKQNQISSLLADENFSHYLHIQDLESKTSRIPWSDYVRRILEILDTIKSVEESRGGVQLSEFKVDLEKLSLNGEVSNLKVLYGNRFGSGGLLDKFNGLDFLSDISVRKLEKLLQTSTTKPKSENVQKIFIEEEEENLKKLLGVDVKISLSKKQTGKISISFSNQEEYERIINSLK